jgi:hypothetical protein
MTRLLVVHPDPTLARSRAAELAAAGYVVEACLGPSGRDCPILDDQPCPLLDQADALLYDAALGTPREMEYLAAHLRDTYADLPLIVIGAERATGRLELEGPRRVWPVSADASIEQLTNVVESALTEQGMAT